jgi:hypothetical protein
VKPSGSPSRARTPTWIPYFSIAVFKFGIPYVKNMIFQKTVL